MNLLVFLQDSRLGERLLTPDTGKGFISCMYQQVCLQATTRGESLATLGAGKQLLFFMVPLVSL